MLKLKGQTESGKWVEFNISQVCDVCFHNKRWCIKGYPNDYVIDTTTIRPADDPRKAMLNEILKRVYKYSYADWHRMLMVILDEMEAKL